MMNLIKYSRFNDIIINYMNKTKKIKNSFKVNYILRYINIAVSVVQFKSK